MLLCVHIACPFDLETDKKSKQIDSCGIYFDKPQNNMYKIKKFMFVICVMSNNFCFIWVFSEWDSQGCSFLYTLGTDNS